MKFKTLKLSAKSLQSSMKNLKLSILAIFSLGLIACTPDRGAMIQERQVEESVLPQELSDTLGADVKSADISYCRFKYFNKHEATHLGDRLFGTEFTHGHLTMRTQEKSRAGMYCHLMLSGVSDIAKGCTIELSIDASNKAKVSTYVFTVAKTECVFREIKLGLTGKDWTDPKANINAWKVVIKSPEGDIVAEKRSWLWSIKEERELRIF